jgi:hypothetical protein
MASFRCPHPSHGGAPAALKSNNDRVFECPVSHRFYRREEKGRMVLVDLITSDAYDATPAETGVVERGGAPPLQLNFMTDVPRVAGNLDFDDLSLSAAQWKLLAKVDGSSTLEEARLLAGLSAEDAERVVRSLLDAGILELHRRR